MKEISQKEFEKYVVDIIEGKKTKTQIVNALETSHRTLTNRIQLLFATNPELHKEYVERFPYTPKERKDVESLEIAIEILIEEKSKEEIAKSHGISIRTISRRISSLKKSKDQDEREIYDLCRIIGNNHSRCLENSAEVQIRIEKILEKYPRIETDKTKAMNVELRRQELLRIEQEYNELCTIMPKEEAATKMGYSRNRIYKLLNELYCIEIEAQAKKQSDFRRALEANIDKQNMHGKIIQNGSEIKNVKLEDNEQEKE